MNCSFGMSDKIILLSSAWGVELETNVIRRFAKISMGSYSRLSLIAYDSYVASQFHVLLCVNARYAQYLKCESGSSHFQLAGEGPIRGLLRDCEPSDGASFQALMGRRGEAVTRGMGNQTTILCYLDIALFRYLLYVMNIMRAQCRVYVQSYK